MVRDTFALLGSATTSGLLIGNADKGWILFSSLMTFFGLLVAIWFKDDNEDGKVDVFED